MRTFSIALVVLGSLGLFGSATPLPALEHSNSITDAQNLALRVKRFAPGADGFNPVSHELESRANKKKKKGPSESLGGPTSYFSDSSLDGEKSTNELKKQGELKIGKPSLAKAPTMKDFGAERTYAEPGPPPPVPGSQKEEGPGKGLERQTSYFSDSSLDGKKPRNKLKKQRTFKIGNPSPGKALTMEDVGGERTYAEPGPPPPVPGSQKKKKKV